MVKKRKFEKQYANKLLSIASGDLETAEVLLEANRGRMENVCYHAEQVMEKSLKAVICHREGSIPLTHDLGVLVGYLDSQMSIPFGDELSNLTSYATVHRYEEGSLILNSEDLNAIVQKAREILRWARSIVAGAVD